MSVRAEWLTVVEASRLMRSGDLSPLEYAGSVVKRIRTIDPTLCAFIDFDPEAFLRQARRAQAAWEDDRGSPLLGIPFGVKDVVDVAGWPTTAQSALLSDRPVTTDATIVRRLKETGAVVAGKLNTHEFAIGGPSFDLPHPPARNPWAIGRHPGGSSSGSGSAVAAGLVPLALGTDTGGSVRHPAAMCGVVGVKLTTGLVDMGGVVPLSPSLDSLGLIAQTVADCRFVMGQLMQWTAARPPSSLGGLRIGHLRGFAPDYQRPAPAEILQVLGETLGTLRTEGARVTSIDAFDSSRIESVYRIIALSEAFAVHRSSLLRRPESYGRLARQRILPGALVPAHAYVAARRQRDCLQQEYEHVMRDLDVLVCLTAREVASELDGPHQGARSGDPLRMLANVIGAPAVALPIGVIDGLPISMQLMGKRHDDEALLGWAEAVQEVLPWPPASVPEPVVL